MKQALVALGLCVASFPWVRAQIGAPDPGDEPTWPTPEVAQWSIPNFGFDSGETIASLDITYKTIGELQLQEDGSTNAIFLMHGSTGEADQFLNDNFAGQLFNPGQALDSSKYFIIMRDGIGHGNTSNPRDTGLRGHFPSYQYTDQIRADHQLLTEHLGVNHTRLMLGVSMGGMHAWQWGEMYPDFMDALMPIACFPTQITGHNRLWRKFFIDLITNDPAYKDGEYDQQPFQSLEGALSIAQLMFSSPKALQRLYPTRDDIDRQVEGVHQLLVEHTDQFDANNQIFAWNASYTYDAEPDLAKIKAPLTAINTADDLMNPPELGILEKAVNEQMTPGVGKAVIIPESEETVGHASYILANLWVEELKELLKSSERARP